MLGPDRLSTMGILQSYDAPDGRGGCVEQGVSGRFGWEGVMMSDGKVAPLGCKAIQKY